MQLLVKHETRYHYLTPISESFMELRMQPRTEANQRCWRFRIETTPRATILSYRDFLGNLINHFDIPGQHGRLTIIAESLVEISPPPPLPQSLSMEAWSELDEARDEGDHWDMLQPTRLTTSESLLDALMYQLQLNRDRDPLSAMFSLCTSISQHFAYAPATTAVDSPIDHALEIRQGVCQDFAHIMIAAGRYLGVPCRYVSGYLYHREEDHDRSSADASHAWVEAFLPGLGWIGFDPTNDILVGERHIRVAVGRDYDDVAPTKGVFRGQSESELTVSVQVSHADEDHAEDLPSTTSTWSFQSPVEAWDEFQQQQQQQQQ